MTPKQPPKKSPFDLGYDAGHDGLGEDANPYDIHLPETEEPHLEWLDGWEQAHEDHGDEI